MEQDFLEVLEAIRQIAANFPALTSILLFGSRGRRDHRRNSDVDLCIFLSNHNRDDVLDFRIAVDELDTYFSFDILDFQSLQDELLKENILKEGVVIYEQNQTPQ